MDQIKRPLHLLNYKESVMAVIESGAADVKCSWQVTRCELSSGCIKNTTEIPCVCLWGLCVRHDGSSALCLRALSHRALSFKPVELNLSIISDCKQSPQNNSDFLGSSSPERTFLALEQVWVTSWWLRLSGKQPKAGTFPVSELTVCFVLCVFVNVCASQLHA